MLGPLPRLAGFSAGVFGSTLKAKVLKDDGSAYAVFDQFKPWVDSVVVQRDKLNETRIFASAVKGDVDEHAARIGDLERRLAVQEARPVTTFP